MIAMTLSKYQPLNATQPKDIVKNVNSLTYEARQAHDALAERIERNFKSRVEYNDMENPPAFGNLHASEIIQKLIELGILTKDGINRSVSIT